MIQVYKTPSLLRGVYPGLVWQRASDEEIYLTFDDGPTPEVTEWVMQVLAKFEAKATFFCVGDNLRKYPELQVALMEQGHVVANHTFNHVKGWAHSDEDYLSNVAKCDQAITNANSLFRPPYGRIKKSQIKKLSDREIIMWSHLSWDFDKNMNAARSISALSQAAPGSILVFHDSVKSYQNLKKILEPILTHLSRRNLKFATLL